MDYTDMATADLHRRAKQLRVEWENALRMEEIAEEGDPTLDPDLADFGFDAHISAQLAEGVLEEIEAELRARGEPLE